MKINTNMSALIAANQLRKSDNKVASSLERLSSGYKINSAEDNPVGNAISKKMKTQLRGLDRAIQNASDGISVVDTADGALQEVASILQRMRELAVQGASDTYRPEDRVSINDEINALKEEINRISKDTEFNTKGLINGECAKTTFSNCVGMDIQYTSDTVDPGQYVLFVTEGTKSEFSTTGAPTELSQGGIISLNGENMIFAAGTPIENVFSEIRQAATRTQVTFAQNNPTDPTAGFNMISDTEGTSFPIEFGGDDQLLAELGISAGTYTEGKDAVVEFCDAFAGGSGFSNSCSITTDGNVATIVGSNNFEMKVKIDPGSVELALGGGTGTRAICTFTVLDTGTMTVQVGANEDQEIEIEIPEVSTEAMDIEHLNLLSQRGCENAMTELDEAISYLSSVRAKIGAYQNRMDHAVKSLGVTEENMTSAMSRITDVDMAEEMTAYTSQNVINQAAISMLSQANQVPEKVLQLLNNM